MSAVTTPNMPVPRLSPGMLALVLLAHAGVLLQMLNVRNAGEPIVLPRPLTVSLIKLAQETAKPEPRPQLPRPVFKPLPQPPVLTVERPIEPAEAITVVEAPKQIAEPLPVLAPAPAVVAAPAKAATTQPSVIEPRFDANYLHNPRPAYPLISKRMGEQGIVQLRVYVNADGSVVRLELKRSSGHARLDQSAMSAVQNWRFVPARQGNQATAAWVVVPIHFTLGS